MIDELAHTIIGLVDADVKQERVDPVKAADAVLYSEISVLVIGRRGTEDRPVQPRHHVALDKVQQSIDGLLRHVCEAIPVQNQQTNSTNFLSPSNIDIIARTRNRRCVHRNPERHILTAQ